jgi:nitrite reductase/ring-hydroxylating ferredoxin subunit
MSEEIKVCTVAKLPPGKVVGAGPYAVGNADGELFAVTRRCRHLMADLADGSIASDGCLVCPWHHAKYDVETGRMVRGPQGIFAKIPFLGTSYKILTTVLPLRRGKVTKRKTTIYVE